MSLIFNPYENVIHVADMLYYEANPNTTMDVPSFVYEQVEMANRRRLLANSTLNLYDWCKAELTLQKKNNDKTGN